MTRIVAIVGSVLPEATSGARTLPMSDRGAIALALGRFVGDVCAYAADAEARCYALAAGVETIEEISDLEMGAFSVALVGRGGCAERGDLFAAELAEASGAALVYDVIDVKRETDGLAVTRDLGRGARDLLGVRGRAVLVVAESVERGPYVSRYRMHAVKAASSESVARGEPGGKSAAREEPICVGWEPTTPRVRLGDCATRVAGSAVERMNALFGVGETAQNAASLVRGSAEECARHLLRYLSHHGFVERGLGGEPQSVSGEAVASRAAARRTERSPREMRAAMDSQSTAPRSERSAARAESVPTRLRRRPRALRQNPLATRGPFEVGVDI